MRCDFYVYVYFRPDTGEPCYIGKGRGERWLKHLWGHSPNSHLRNIILACDRKLPYLKIRTGLTETEAFAIERALIVAIGREPLGPLVNLSDGGDGGINPSPETRAKMSAAKRGKQGSRRGSSPSEATREKLRLANLGKKNGPPAAETRTKIATKLLGNKNGHGQIISEDHRRKISIRMRGNKHGEGAVFSADRREKIGASHRGLKHSDVTKAKIVASLLGRVQSEETRAKRSAALKGRRRPNPKQPSLSEIRSQCPPPRVHTQNSLQKSDEGL